MISAAPLRTEVSETVINIQGFLKTTLLDYPGHVAATVFVGGCNMRCPFCHNMDIVTSNDSPAYSEEDILRFRQKRAGILDGVCITGGEPTLCNELPAFISSIRQLGYRIKLDTNGTNPRMLASLINDKLTDYVAMDIKSSFSGYEKACGISGIKLAPIKESIDLLINGKCDYEFRTTAVSELLDDNAVREIGQLLKGAKRYFLQGYVESEFVPDKSLTPVGKEKLLQYQQELSSFINEVALRGID